MAAFPGVGDDFGRYRIVRELGRGGMGAVFEARDPTLDRSVALKVILPTLSGEDAFRRRFEREAAVLARVRSRHIVGILEYGEHDGLLFLVTQYLPDGDLESWLARHGPLDVRTAVTLTSQLCEALGDAHAAGVVHRDVKPSNVLLWHRPDGGLVAYLCDFGIATDAEVSGTRLTQAGAIIGSPGFMPPERHLGEPADVRGDVYALGCVLHSTLTGAPPFEGTAMELRAAHLQAPVPQLPGRTAAETRLNGLLRWTMAKNPAERPASTVEVGRELDAVARQLDAAPATVVPRSPATRAAPTHAPPPYPPAPAGGGSGRRGWIAALAALTVLVVAAVVTVVVLASGDDDPDEAASDPPTTDTPPTTTSEPTETSAPPGFPPDTRMAELVEQGTVVVGVRFDQPGLGLVGTDGEPAGFDVDVARLLAADLGLDPDGVEFVEVTSATREAMLQSGEVDLVVATYSITDERRTLVGQAGPYLETGQQLLVPTESDVDSLDDLAGEPVCAVDGSTSLQNVIAGGAVADPAPTYEECLARVVDGTAAAMSTDGVILLGYAGQADGEVKVVGDPFTEERLGIGYSRDEPELCAWINGVLERSFEDGSWAAAFEKTLGTAGAPAPAPPALDRCP